MLKCFVAVARSGHLSTAANSLGRTPSAVSMMLKQFEEHLGAPLFESERKSRLTALGRFVLLEAERELAHFERSVNTILRYARSEEGLVRIAAVPSVANSLLPQVIQTFIGLRPGVELDIRDTDSAGIRYELEHEIVDVGIGTGFDSGAEIECELLLTDAFGLVCRADDPLLAREHAVRWCDLASVSLIGNRLCQRIDQKDVQTALTRTHITVHNTTSLLAMIRAGLGITVLPKLTVANIDDTLRFIKPVDSEYRRRIDLMTLRRSAPSPATEVFCTVLREVSASMRCD